MSIMFNDLGIVQAGYELGSIYNAGGFLLRPYIGGYLWQISSWTTSIGSKGLETSGGWVGGLQRYG